MLGAHLRPFAEPRTILRWVAAVAAMIATYMVVLVSGLALGLWWKAASTLYLAVVFAARFGIQVGIHVAPEDRRRAALWVFIGIVVAVPALVFLGIAIWGQLRYLDYLAVLLNAAGAFIAYLSEKRSLARNGESRRLDQAL